MISLELFVLSFENNYYLYSVNERHFYLSINRSLINTIDQQLYYLLSIFFISNIYLDTYI